MPPIPALLSRICTRILVAESTSTLKSGTILFHFGTVTAGVFSIKIKKKEAKASQNPSSVLILTNKP